MERVERREEGVVGAKRVEEEGRACGVREGPEGGKEKVVVGGGGEKEGEEGVWRKEKVDEEGGGPVELLGATLAGPRIGGE